MDVLARITSLREKRKWTIWRLSEESGVDQSTISAWYKKGRSPSVSSLEKICAAFGISMSLFFADEPTSVNLSEVEFELLKCWSALSAKQKDTVLNLIKTM